MKEYLPSIGIQKGFYYTNNFNNHQRYSSVDNTKKNYNKNYNYLKYNNPFRPKQIINNNNNENNFLKISNENKDDINSFKKNSGKTFYNNNFTNNKKLSNNKIQNNLFSQTYNNYYQKFKDKYSNNNFNSKSHNNIKIIQENRNNNKAHNITIKNFNLFLPDFQNVKYDNNNNNDNKNKIKLAGKTHSYSVSNKENKAIININNNKFNLDNNNNFFSYDKLDNKKSLSTGINKLAIIGYNPDNSNNNPFLLQTKSYTKNRGISQDNRYFKPYKTINLFNRKNNNSSTKRKCPLCHKEIERYKYKFHYNLHPSKIFDWLFLGSYRNAIDKQEIKDLEINYVLNCAVECLESFPAGVKYCHLKINDMPSFKILPFLDKASFFIHQAKVNNGKILVHCQMGISRSTSCVIAYMIRYMGYSSMNALDFIKKKRSIVMPNFGFLQQLMLYEKNNLGTF